MKIYEVVFQNKKYAGERERTYQVGANNLILASKKAIKELDDDKDNFSSIRNWEIIKIEKIAEINL
jgi:hypothetical protein